MAVANSAVEEFDVISMQWYDVTDQQEGMVVNKVEIEGGDGDFITRLGGFRVKEGLLLCEGFSYASGSVGDERKEMALLKPSSLTPLFPLTSPSLALPSTHLATASSPPSMAPSLPSMLSSLTLSLPLPFLRRFPLDRQPLWQRQRHQLYRKLHMENHRQQ